MSYVFERFEAAVQALISDGPVKKRLTQAYSEHLDDLAAVELPGDDDLAFSDLHRALHSVLPVGKEGSIQASVQKMSTAEASWHAQTILRLYGELLKAGRQLEPLSIVDASRADPPPYLVGSGR